MIAAEKAVQTAKFTLRYILVTLVVVGVIGVRIFAGVQFFGESWVFHLPERLIKNNEQCFTIEEVATQYNCKVK